MGGNIKSKSIFFLLSGIMFISSILSAQGIPTDYKLERKLSKISDITPASNTVDRIFVQDKNTIWLGTSRGLCKTTDNGNSWTNYYGTKSFGTESVSAVAYGLGAIWAATWHSEDNSGSIIPVGTGLRYSVDGGQTWITIDQPVDTARDSVFTYGVNSIRASTISVPEQNFIYGIAFTKNTIWIVSFAGGLRRSTDMGKTWQRVLLPSDNLDSIKPTDKLNFFLAPQSTGDIIKGNLNHRGFSIVSAGDDTLYVGTAGGVNKTTNANDQYPGWVKFNHTNQSNPISGNHVLCLSRNSIDGTIWAGTWKAEGSTEYYGVSYSKDGGKNWSVTLTDERIKDFGFRIIPSTEVIAAGASGLYRSGNNGSTWMAAPKIKDSESKVELRPTEYLSAETNTLNSGTSEIWVGTNDGVAKSTELTTDSWWAKWKVYFASGKTTSSNSSFVFPNPFNPKTDLARIKYNLTNGANVTLRIMDFGMNLVRTVLQNAPRVSNQEQIDYWDGRDENGKTVPNGVYFYRLDVDGADPMFGKIIVLM